MGTGRIAAHAKGRTHASKIRKPEWKTIAFESCDCVCAQLNAGFWVCSEPRMWKINKLLLQIQVPMGLKRCIKCTFVGAYVTFCILYRHVYITLFDWYSMDVVRTRNNSLFPFGSLSSIVWIDFPLELRARMDGMVKKIGNICVTGICIVLLSARLSLNFDHSQFLWQMNRTYGSGDLSQLLNQHMFEISQNE